MHGIELVYRKKSIFLCMVLCWFTEKKIYIIMHGSRLVYGKKKLYNIMHGIRLGHGKKLYIVMHVIRLVYRKQGRRKNR